MAILNQPESKTIALPALSVLTVTADSASSGAVSRLGDKAGDEGAGVAVIGAGVTQTFGPYPSPARFEIRCASGFLTYNEAVVALSDYVTAAQSVALSLDTIDDLDEAEALDGSEPVVVIQDGVAVQTTAQDIANLNAETEAITNAVDAAIAAGIAEDGVIDMAIESAIDDAIDEDLAENGPIATAIVDAVAALKAEAVAPLDDQTGGTPGTTLATCGNTQSSDQADVINDNFASLNQQIEDLKAALVAANTLTEAE